MAEAPVRYGPTAIGTGAAAIVTAGAASTWVILRDITITNETAATINVTLGIFTSAADAAGRRLLYSFPITASSDPWTWGGFLPLLGGASPDVLYALGSATGLTITVGAVTGP